LAEIKLGDYVRVSDCEPRKGLVVEVGYNMWGEEENPSGVVIMLCDGQTVIVYEQEVESLSLYTE